MMNTSTTEWRQLQSEADQVVSLNELFLQDKQRTQKFSVDLGCVYLDYSKQLINTDIKHNLIQLAKTRGLKSAINCLVSGHMVNVSEKRAALHTALRLPPSAEVMVNGENIVQQVHDALDKLSIVVNRLTKGLWRGYSGKVITDVINIGVGGSDLGPLMACTSMKEWENSDEANQIDTHFVSNMDGTQLDELLTWLNPETTVFVICSKSFSTSDTFSNASTALGWLLASCNDEKMVKKNHFIGISAKSEKMDCWGIHRQNQLKLWDWVGGRFSMWSTIGLTIAVKIGMENFRQLLAGAHEMDLHFINTEFDNNMPVIMGLLGVWNSTFLSINAHTVLPYDGRLKYFPNYLTQLEMESNGKSVGLHGEKINFKTCPILWGDVGSNAQHAFYQLLHQGTQRVSCDFIACIERYDRSQKIDGDLVKQHQLSLSNCFAQSRVLAFGNAALDYDMENHPSHKRYHGNQPSTTILLKKLTPKTLGMLIALYEHKVFVMSVIWGINPFDQWGVELGKVMATELYDSIQTQKLDFDSSTNELLKRVIA